MGALVAAMKRAGAHTVGFDVAFAEPERNVAQELIDATSASGQLAHRDYLDATVKALLFSGLQEQITSSRRTASHFISMAPSRNSTQPVSQTRPWN